jgi:hypothetical protein
VPNGFAFTPQQRALDVLEESRQRRMGALLWRLLKTPTKTRPFSADSLELINAYAKT